MLGTYLDEHPLINMMKGTVDCPYPSMDDRAGWEAVPAEDRAALIALAEKYRSIPYPMLLATDFMAFVRNGSRKANETPYFLRRTKLIAAAMGCCASGKDDDLDQVIDGLWCICEETSWVISAHNGSSHEGMRPASERPLPDVQNPYVDLFAAQTAMILSLVCSMVGEHLDKVAPVVRRRVQLEIERRVLIPFMTRDDYWWMGFIRKDLCNWTPWIVSNVMMTARLCIGDKRRLAELLDRACCMLDRFLAVLPQDGGCDEGAGYWNMAGGALLDCLELLEQVTDGQMTFWQDEKLRNVVSFPAKAQLENGWFVNFADCDARPYISGERLQYAGERLGDQRLIAMGMQLRQEPGFQLSDTPQMWRLLNELFHPKVDVQTEKLPPRDVWLPDLQVRVLEKNGSILIAKGGHNAESHNHNDVGAFMLYVDGEPAVVDAGNMTYTAKTFSDRRYELWNIRSMYHNVPMIGGVEQQVGGEHCAEQVEYYADGMSLHMNRAYPAEADVRFCSRLFTLNDSGEARVEDRIACGHDVPVTWVFMLRHQPVVAEQLVTAGNVIISVPEGMMIASEEIVIDDARMARNYPGSLWRLTCTDTPNAVHCAAFTFRRNDQ